MGNLSQGIGSSYYDYARRGQVYSALALVTGCVIYSTATGTGGPLLWNNSGKGTQRVLAVLLGLGIGVTTASAAGTSIGITGNSGQTAAPSSSTAIDAGPANMLIGGPAPQCNVYRVGTVTNPGNFFQPMVALGTGALTVDNVDFSWIDIGGSIVVPNACWASVAAGATATTSVLQVGLMWAEVPY